MAMKEAALRSVGGESVVVAAGTYVVEWLQKVATHEPVGKIGMAALAAAMARIESAFTTALVFVVVAWALDFVVGVSRAIADKDQRLKKAKVWNGMMRLFVICALSVTAAMLEGMIFSTVGWDPSGKIVLAICVAMFWEECISIQENGRFFYKRLKFDRFKFPWMNDDEEDDS